MQFAGLYSDVHHIVPEADDGPNTIDNAIPLCLRCHGEAGHYNPRHPIGNKYSPSELRKHRDRLWQTVEQNPAVALPVGPLLVSPGRIPFPYNPGEQSVVHLTFNNQSARPLYGISIAVVLRGAEFEPKLRPTAMMDPPVLKPETFEIIRFNPDVMIMEGKLRGLPVMYLAVWGTEAQTTHRVRMEAAVGKSVPAGTDVYGVCHLLRFGDEQPRIVRRPSSIEEGWNEALVQVWIGDVSYYMGVVAGPPIERS
jgi:hypothetical protein